MSLYKEIRAIDKSLDEYNVSEVSSEFMSETIVHPEIIDGVIDVAKSLMYEVRSEELAERAGQIAAGGDWGDGGLRPGSLDPERKKSLLIVSAFAIFCEPTDARHKPMHEFNKRLGKLKDEPTSVFAARRLADTMSENPTITHLFGATHTPADPETIRQRIYKGIESLYPVLEQDDLSERKFHTIRKNVRRLALVNVLAHYVEPDLMVNRDTLLLRSLHKRMGSERIVKCELDEAHFGVKRIEPSEFVKDIAAQILAQPETTAA